MKIQFLYKRLLFIFKKVITSQCKGMTGLQIIAHMCGWPSELTCMSAGYCIWTLIHVFGHGAKTAICSDIILWRGNQIDMQTLSQAKACSTAESNSVVD